MQNITGSSSTGQNVIIAMAGIAKVNNSSEDTRSLKSKVFKKLAVFFFEGENIKRFYSL